MSFASGHRGVPVCPIDWSKSSGSSRVRYIFLQTYLDVYKQSDKNRQRGQLKFIKVNQSSSRSTNMAQLALHALTGFLSLVYIAMGVVKLYPVSQQMAFAVTRSFQAYAKVCPTVLFGYIPEPQKYHMTIGVWEACCGLALLVGDRELKQGASGILLVIMGVMITSNVIIKDYSTMFFFAMHFFFLSFLFAKYRRRSQPVKTEEEENFKKE
ncbi:uncharacterized protein LOC110452295 isoform X1 [Mizuhopecten yessoensis]|uniref:Transmembrane protein 35B n=1 Tax=Mizuhopecten yessoensis TaxID=6573 RepID=A0A210QJW3_MIZYE|nr:uncharacterized protein LOC110452295 isoform X1 [Mizuhopecten yessoensis]OWF49043.1 hypothetical protein KP79_PYT07022 [Mizuhopecten yessoensis]